MTMHLDEAKDHSHHGQVAVLLAPESADLSSCRTALRASGIDSQVEQNAHSAKEIVVKAAIPFDHRPSLEEIEAAKLSVVQALSDSAIAHEIRGVGFETARDGDRPG